MNVRNIASSVDIKKLFRTYSELTALQSAHIEVAIFIDTTADRRVIARIKEGFKTSASNVGFDIRAFSDSHLETEGAADLAIIVAGDSPLVGATAAITAAHGSPTVVIGDAEAVCERAAASGFPLKPEGVVDCNITHDPFMEDLLDNLGAWIVQHCREKRLTLSATFPFTRGPLAAGLAYETAVQNALVGALVVLPGADLPTMTLNQAKMVLQDTIAYGEKLDARCLPDIALCVGGAFLSRTLARKLVKTFPGLAWIIKAGVGYGTTLAIGILVRKSLEHAWGSACLSSLEGLLENIPLLQRGHGVESVPSAARSLDDGEGDAPAVPVSKVVFKEGTAHSAAAVMEGVATVAKAVAPLISSTGAVDGK